MSTPDAGASTSSTAPEAEKPFAVPSVPPTPKPDVPHLATSTIVAIAHAAHQICPYSKAVRGNIDVALNVITA